MYEQDSVEYGVVNLDATEFCRNLESLSRFNIMPHWKSKGGYMNNSKFGPFQFGKEINVDELNFHNVKLIMQKLICLPLTLQVSNNAAKVYAVFRVVPYPWDNEIGTVRTGPSSTTLSAEGTWNTESGRLCMIGCLGSIDDRKRCNTHVSLFFPRVFSLGKRSICVGSISSSHIENGSYLPLVFDVQVSPYVGKIDYNFYSSSYLTYNYSKIELASKFRGRVKPGYFNTMIRKELLTYPAPWDGKESSAIIEVLHIQQSSRSYPIPGNDGKDRHKPASPCNLFNTLKVNTFGAASSNQKSNVLIQIQVLSLGPLVGCCAYTDKSPEYDDGNQGHLTNHHLINVSLNLEISEKTVSSKLLEISKLSLEGLYDPLVGEMYLIGCRKVMAGNPDLERGLDCLIEVKIDYPSLNLWWIRNPSAMITINSKRDPNDPLFFAQVRISDLEVNYLNKYRDIVFRKLLEAFFKILQAFLIVVAVVCQLYHTENNQDSISYISLVMLGIQILGYCLPLISGADTLFRLREYVSYEQGPMYILYFQFLDYIGKVLLLASLLLTSRLFQKVLASRKRPLPKVPSRPVKHVPSDKKVLLITVALHNLGFFISLAMHSMLVQPRAKNFYREEGSPVLPDWLFRLDEYVCIIRDFFLLPQVIGNFLWHMNAKPLGKMYYMGITLLGILQQLSDYIRVTVTRPSRPMTEIEDIPGNAFSKFANFVTVFIMVILAVMVHYQEHYQKHQKIVHQLK